MEHTESKNNKVNESDTIPVLNFKSESKSGRAKQIICMPDINNSFDMYRFNY